MISALVIEDNPQWLQILNHELVRGGFVSDIASDRGSARAYILDQREHKLIVLDAELDTKLGITPARLVLSELRRLVEDGVIERPTVFVISGAYSLIELRDVLADHLDLVDEWFEKNPFDDTRFRKSLAAVRDATD